MEIRHLRCFVAVADELHFGRAARRLHVAQPAVSQTVRTLEKELGLQLFDRANRRVGLTDAGIVLLGEARAALARFDALVATMSRLHAGTGATISVGAVPALPPELVPRLLALLAQDRPGPTAVVRAAPSGRDPTELLAGGAFDLVLVRGVVDLPGLDAVVVAREAVGVAVSVEHPLAERPAVAPGDLNGVPLISFARSSDPDEFDRLYAPLLSAGLKQVDLVHESHEGAVDASLRLVERKVGVSLKLASEVAAFASPAVTWRPLDGISLEVVVSAVWRPDRTSPALHRLVDVLRGT